jgi:hypothetical protein
MSGFGGSSDWLRNLEAGGPCEVQIGRERFVAHHRVLRGADAAAVVEDYEHRNRVVAPIVRAVLSRLLGWRYHGSEAERQRLVEQLPLVVLSPRPPPTAG